MPRLKKTFYRTSPWDDDRLVEKSIARAETGNLNDAWWLVAHIAVMLRERKKSAPLSDYAASFFEKLLDLRGDEKDGPNELAEALKALHIVRSRGQPERDLDTSDMLAARVVLLKRAGLSVDVALNSLDKFDDFPRRAYRSAYEAPRTKRAERFGTLLTAEIETLAGMSTDVLLEALRKTGSLPPGRNAKK